MRVRVRNPEYARQHLWYFAQPEFYEYQGQETQLKWAKPDELCLTTGNPEWPVRIIQRKLIVDIDGQNSNFESKDSVTRIVKGSKGQEYTVTQANGRWSCTCPGFQFRKNCQHTTEFAG